MLGRPKYRAEFFERFLLPVVAIDVGERAHQRGERLAVDATVLLDAVLRARAKLIERPAGLGDADYWHVEVPAPRHAMQGRKDLLVGEVTCCTEEHEGICRR